ncbi:MAG: Do family serine endopeptidase [Muribaculaceae bacterium]|nr:Do family serine endopeptidase [Muribaculaceae bacterium]
MNKNLQTVLIGCAVAVAASAATVSIMQPRTINPAIEDTQLADTRSNGNVWKVANHPGVENDFTKAAESTINGVVSIKSFAAPRASQGRQGYVDPFFEFFFGSPYGQQQQPRQQQQEQQQQPLGLGSGVIISEDGYIVTNNHVVDGADRLEITLNDNRTFNATVIGTDPTTDLALIKIEAKNLPVIPFGDSDALKVGEWVLAVGNPFGFTSTVTTGIVSAKARSISSATNSRRMGIESYIQTDAAVNPGNSGGALVNLAGELVGINTAIYSQTGNYAGYSFAIPTSIVTKIMSDIKQYGTVQRAVLGITYRELTPELKKENDITAVNDGLLVEEVVDRSAAMNAGIRKGDVIIALNDVATHNGALLMEQINRFRPGDKVKITFVRANQKQSVETTLFNNQGSTGLVQAANIMNLGCAFKKLSDDTKKELKVSYGVQVTGIKDGKFKDAGIKDGFVILDINNARVNSAEDVEKVYNSIMKTDEYDKVMFITGIYPTGRKMYYAVDLAD